MNNFKITVAKDLHSCILKLSSDIQLTESDLLSMFEYPPDSSLGDIAFPCFILAKKMRKAPPETEELFCCEKCQIRPFCLRHW